MAVVEDQERSVRVIARAGDCERGTSDMGHRSEHPLWIRQVP